MQPRSITTTHATIPIFANEESARSHIRDHLLTDPEGDVWPLVQPKLLELGDWYEVGGRARWWRSIHDGDRELLAALYDAYADAIEAAYRDAERLRWIATEGGITVALGTSGLLLVVIGGCVRSAFLPGQGVAAAVVAARAENGTARWLPRQFSLRPRSIDRTLHPREQARRRERYERWSAEEKLFYRVFRNASQFVWSRHTTNHDHRGQRREDYALLKNCLPRRSECKFSIWQTWRLQGV